MEIITLIVAIAGFVLSLSIWIKELSSNRVRIGVRILEVNAHANAAYMYLLIENKSRLPLTINDIRLLLNGAERSCAQMPKIIWTRTKRRNGKIYDQHEELSSELPIFIAALGGVRALVLFEELPASFPSNATTLNLKFCTNRRNLKL